MACALYDGSPPRRFSTDTGSSPKSVTGLNSVSVTLLSRISHTLTGPVGANSSRPSCEVYTMPDCPRDAYTCAIIGLTARLAHPIATWSGFAGLVSGPRTLKTHGTPIADLTGPTNLIAGWKTLAKAKVIPTSSPISATFCGVSSNGKPRASKQSAAPHFDEAARLPCLTMVTPAAAATTEPIVDRFTVAAPSPPVPTMSVVSP